MSDDKMSPGEKEKVKVYHGDSISFVWDRCFGFAPQERSPLQAKPKVARNELPWETVPQIQQPGTG